MGAVGAASASSRVESPVGTGVEDDIMAAVLAQSRREATSSAQVVPPEAALGVDDLELQRVLAESMLSR